MDIQQRICDSKDSLIDASNTLAYLLSNIYKQNVHRQRVYLVLKGMAQHILQPVIEQMDNIGAVTLLNPTGNYQTGSLSSNYTLCSQ